MQLIEKYYPIFEKIIAYKEWLKTEQQQLDKTYTDLLKKAKLFVVHYYQVMFLAIERGELQATITSYYGLNYPFDLPKIETDEDLICQSKILFDGDSRRIGDGGKYFANPNIGTVKVWVDKFMEAYQVKTNKFNVKQAEIENIENIRKETDEIIEGIFQKLCNNFAELSFEEQQQEFLKFGIEIEEGENPLKGIIKDEIKPDSIEIQANRDELKSKKTDQLQFSLFFSEKDSPQ
jgi:hypothetical protein